MVRPTRSTTHGLGHIVLVSFPSDDVLVNLMPVLRVWMLPGRLMSVGQVEDCVGSEEVVHGTGCEQQQANAVTFTHSLCSKDSMHARFHDLFPLEY